MRKRKFSSVWDALESKPADAASMKARSKLMIAIQQAVAEWKTTQTTAAKRLGLTQPRLNDLLRGRINKFSLDALIDLAMRAGLKVKVEVSRAAA
jgi:predicted XRE-type DNA-binding protein